MSIDDNSTSTTIKTTLAGQDAKIHAPKTTWSTGNYVTPEPPKDNPKDTPVDIPKDNNANGSYTWLLCKHLSDKLR
jgi:hypothetical protein